jgi:glycerol kinase
MIPMVPRAPRAGPLYLAIDQGSHGSRAVVFSGEGAIEAEATVAVGTHVPRPGWVEHDPQELLRSVQKAVEGAMERLGPRSVEVVAAGLAAQRSNVVCWDRVSGEPLSPVISWQDLRAAEWMRGLRAHEALVRARSGLVLSAHYGAGKLRWCLDHLPAVRKALRAGRLALGPMTSFLLFRLLRQRPLCVDPTTATRTLLLDVEARDWCPALLELFGVPREALPACVPCRHRFGDLCAAGHDIPLAVTVGDQAAALFAAGEPGPRDAVVNVGTGAFVQRPVGGRRVSVPGLLASVAWQDDRGPLYVVEGTVNGAGSALCGMGGRLGVDPQELADLLRRPCAPPVFLNGISGLGSPFWIPHFQSRFVGEGTPQEKLVAVAESVIFLLEVNLREMARELGEPQRLRAGGGLAGLEEFCRRLADLTGRPVARFESTEATARGLAWLVAGGPRGWAPSAAACFEPREDAALRRRYRRFRRELSAALRAGA